MDYSDVQMCRICETTSNLSAIFESNSKSIVKRLRACADVSIETDDLLPKCICAQCLENLEFAYKFKIQCEFTDRKFRDALTSSSIKSKVIETLTIDAVDVVDAADDFYDVDHLIETDSGNTAADDGEGGVVSVDDDEDTNHSEIFYLDETEETLDSVESNDDDLERSVSSTTPTENEDAPVEQKKRVQKSLSCDICGNTFATFLTLSEHKRTHGKERYACPKCGKWFEKRYVMKNHLAGHSGLRPFRCEQCNKCYSSQTNLLRHIRVSHQNERNYACDECGKSFSQLAILRQHSSVHTTERNFKCEICDKMFKIKEHLKSHQQRHLPKADRPKRKYKPTKKKYKPRPKTCICSECGKQSNTVALHLSHMKTHSGERPYECKDCGKKFSFQQSLRNHKYLHTGEKKFKCDTCGMTFRQIGHLKGHQLIHTGEKQHKCDVCGKSFTLRSNLTVHMRLHTGETPYHCNVCGKKFYDSNGLKRHRLVHERNNQEKSNEPKPTQEKNETICVSQTIENNSVIISNESDTAQIKVEMPSECGSAMIYTISK